MKIRKVVTISAIALGIAISPVVAGVAQADPPPSPSPTPTPSLIPTWVTEDARGMLTDAITDITAAAVNDPDHVSENARAIIEGLWP